MADRKGIHPVRVVIAYPVPFDAWGDFRDKVERFTRTFKEHPPGMRCEVIAVANWGGPTDEVREMFYGIPCHWDSYFGHGCDGGTWQHVARAINPDDFLICSTSRAYFHRSGWLAQMMAARHTYGEGVYTTSASYECGLHACMRFFGVDAKYFKAYPVEMTCREGHDFETGVRGPIPGFGQFVANAGGKQMVCTWEGPFEKPDWFAPANRFRNGDQSNMLVFDRHTDIYRDASPDEKRHLEAMTNPPKP